MSPTRQIKQKNRTVNGKVYLCDQRLILEQEYKLAIVICNKIKKLVENRNFLIQEKRLNPKIANPDRNWKMTDESEIFQTYKFCVNPVYEVINRLRLYVQYFTGYRLMSFSWSAGKKSIQVIPENYDDILEKIFKHPDEFVRLFIAITRYMPDWMIARPPKILGEVGWFINGSIVNHDTYVYQERLNLLYETGVISWLQGKIRRKEQIAFLEIGGGMEDWPTF